MKSLSLICAAVTVAVLACDDSPEGPSGPGTYEVTIENLASGQPLTPPVVALHTEEARIFQVADAASTEVKEVAENGNLPPLVETLESNPDVPEVVTAVAGDPPPLLPGQSVTVTLSAPDAADRLSFISMLICTNDGFTGLDSRELPDEVGDEVVTMTDAYDAGTELNTEDFADMVPPCPPLTGVDSDEPGTGASDPTLAESGVIAPHPGIQGIADLLPDTHGWSDPVARITIRRTG